jgi:hypothetical protein
MAETFTKRLTRFVAYWRAVTKHARTLLLGFIGGSLISIPAWIKPLLPSESVKWVDSWTAFIAEPQTYWYAAITFVALVFFYATFLAWNEGRDEIQNLASRLHEATPVLITSSPGWDYVTDHFVTAYHKFEPQQMLRFFIEVVNSGANTSLRGWQGHYTLADGKRTFLSDAMFDRSVASEVGQVNLVTDERTLERGGRRLGWVQFPISNEAAGQLRQVAVQFFDHTGSIHSVECPPEWMSKASQQKS